MRRLACLAVLAVGLLVFAGCGKGVSVDTGDGNANVKDNKVEVKTDDGSLKVESNKIEVKTEDGKSQLSIGGEGGVSLPDGYPKDIVPIMDGSKITLASRNEDQQKKVSYWLTMSNEKDPEDVYQYYQGALTDLQEINKMESPGYYCITGAKGDSSIMVTVTEESSDKGKQSIIQIVIGPKQ